MLVPGTEPKSKEQCELLTTESALQHTMFFLYTCFVFRGGLKTACRTVTSFHHVGSKRHCDHDSFYKGKHLIGG